MKQQKSLKQGFTLVEMMMVMGLIALIIALGIPIFAAIAMGKSLGGAGDTIQGAFLKYREIAAARGQPVFVVFELWHMAPELGNDRRPQRIQAFSVQRNATDPGLWDVLEIDDPIELPRGVWFNDNWINNEVSYYDPIPLSVPFATEANILCAGTETYNMGSKSGWAKKLYMVIFLPSGHLAIIGRQNIPGFLIEADPPNEDADVWLTNGEDTMLLEINPNTGRTKTRRILNNVK